MVVVGGKVIVVPLLVAAELLVEVFGAAVEFVSM